MIGCHDCGKNLGIVLIRNDIDLQLGLGLRVFFLTLGELTSTFAPDHAHKQILGIDSKCHGRTLVGPRLGPMMHCLLRVTTGYGDGDGTVSTNHLLI